MHSSSTIQMVRRLMASMRHLMRYIYVAVLFAVLGFVTTISIPVVILNRLFTSESPAWSTLLLLVALGILRGAFRYGEHYYGHYVAFRVLAEYRKAVFSKMRRLAPSKLDRQDSGVLLKMIGEDIEALEVFFAHTIPPVLTASIVLLTLLSYFATVSIWIMLLAAATYMLLALGIPFYFAKRLEPLLHQQTTSRKAYLSRFMDSLRGMRELVQYQHTQAQFSELEVYSRQVNSREKEVSILQFMQTSVTFLVVGVSILFVAGIAIHEVTVEQLTLGSAVIAVVVFSTSFAPFLELSRLPLGFKRAMHAGRHVYTLLDEVEPLRTGKLTAPNIDNICVRNIQFGYDQREHLVFEQFNAAFSGRRIVGIIGESGSGKSTLMKLLMRWYDVHAGDITIDGTSINDVQPQTWQTKYAYIPQVPQLFNQSIRENLTLGNPNITDEMIWNAAKKCNIAHRIQASEEGLDTVLNTNKLAFSAGEAQRLELTRALLKQADCYIFDEPTSNLDSLNEALLLKTIYTHCEGLVFLISHRQSTTSCAEVVYRLESGYLTKVKERSR